VNGRLTEGDVNVDEKLALQALRRGNPAGLNFIIDSYTPYVAAIISGIAGRYMHSSDVEELVSDVFVALWQDEGRISPGKLRPWLAAVARNKARSFLRGHKIELPLEDDTLPWEFDLETKVQQDELYAAVRRAVLEMGEPDKEIFLRHYYYLQPVKVIAEKTGIKESTVKSRLRRGRQCLKKKLIKGGFADEVQDQ